MDEEYVLNGKIVSVGVAQAYFTAEDMDERNMSPNDRLLIVAVDKGDMSNVPVSMTWAKSVRISLRATPTTGGNDER